MNKIVIFLILLFLGGCFNLNTPSKTIYHSTIKKEVRYNIVGTQPRIPISIYKKVLKFMYKRLEEDKIKLGLKNPNLIKDYNSISSFYQYLEKDYNKALEYLKKSSKLSEEIFGQNHIETAKSYENIALLYKRMEGNQDNALKNFQKSLDINRKILGIEHPYTIANINSIGMIYHFKGNYPKALEYYKKIKSDDNLENIGSLYYAMGNYKKALEFYHKLLNTKDLINLEKSKIYSDIGMIHYAYGDYKKALHFHKKSLIADRKVRLDRKPLQRAKIYNNIGKIYYAKEEYHKALDFFKIKSLGINQRYLNKSHPMIAQNYNWIGLTYLMLEKYDDSLKFLNDALTIRENQLNQNHIDIAESYSNIALLYEKQNNYSKSLNLYRKSLDIFKKNKNRNYTILDNQNRLKYKQSSSRFIFNFLRITYLYKNINTKKEAFNYWLNYKREIFDNENTLKILYNKTSNQNTKKKIEQLFNYQRQLAKLYQNIPKDLNKYHINIKHIEEHISQIEISLNSKSLKLNKKDINYKQISKYLKPNELYIDFIKTKDNYFFFTLDRNNQITFKQFDKQETKIINDTIEATKKDIFRIDKAHENYGKLYDLIFKKIDIKNKTSLIISPDGQLGLIPFEAFYDIKEQKYLIEKLKIRYIPSGKELVKLYEDNSEIKSDDIVVFADVNFDNNHSKTQETKGNIFETLTPNYQYLKYSKQDAMIVKKLFPNRTKLFLGKDATEKNLLKINAPKILYLSTHGVFLENKNILNPMLKSLILLDGANESIRQKKGNGIISGLELAGLNLRGTELVVLSACETGKGEIEEAEGVAGISKAFMKAGAKNVIMTLWSVNEKKSSLLMEKFYKKVKNGFSYSDALREAKIWMIKEEPNPFYWSGFVGSGRD